MSPWDGTGDPPEHLLPAKGSLSEATPSCRYCGKRVRWGKTKLGRPCPFDLEPPHVSHFSTCPNAAQARARAGK